MHDRAGQPRGCRGMRGAGVVVVVEEEEEEEGVVVVVVVVGEDKVVQVEDKPKCRRQTMVNSCESYRFK
jgi:hypothetical protein